MGWKDLAYDARDKMLAQKIAGVPVEDLAKKIGMRPTTLDRRLREWATINETAGIRRPKQKQVKWNTPPRFKGDAVIAGDFHMPFMDYDFAEIMLDTAMVLLPEPRRLIVAGDLFNMSAFSSFIATNPYQPSFRSELNVVVSFLEDALRVFDSIDVLLGNHELRFVYRLGQLGHEELEKAVGVDSVKFHEYAYCVIETQTGEWRITHQRNYSTSAQSVGRKLAHKYRQHIITHHQHKVSKGFDDSGMSIVIDNGCMADPEKLDYVSQVDNTLPIMTQSFVVLRGGVANLFVNNTAFTDYSFLEK